MVASSSSCGLAVLKRARTCISTYRVLGSAWLLLVGGFWFGLGLAVAGRSEGYAAEAARLTPTSWADYVPAGKERDAILGDFVLRNDRLVAVIAAPIAGRNANMTVRNVGWCVIDLTQRATPNDQLSAFYPGSLRYAFTNPAAVHWEDDRGTYPVEAGDWSVQRPRVALVCAADAVAGLPSAVVRYSLADGDPFLLVETILSNANDVPAEVELSDTLRADRTFQFGTAFENHLFWADDYFFRQTYGIWSEQFSLEHSGGRGVVIRYKAPDNSKIVIPPRGTLRWVRKLFPAANQLQALGIARLLRGDQQALVRIQVRDPRGPVAGPRIEVRQGDSLVGAARGDQQGQVFFGLPSGQYTLRVEALGRPEKSVPLQVSGEEVFQEVFLDACGYVVARITDNRGNPIPCKVQFHGMDGTATPDFGPDTAVTVKNLKYSHNGRFRQELAPGRYRVIVSYGPEYNAEFRQIEVQAGQETRLELQLERCVATDGWISADFHSHSSPSGDNTTSQRARVLNLLCEHVEFAPCTEHNRIDTYVPHLQALGVEHLMATCSGIELTGALGTVNHQNAFPLRRRPRTQDNGAPLTDENPVTQIARLAMWDNSSEKLVQCNHPDLVQILGDKDSDGKADGGFFEMIQYMDVVEVHPLQPILLVPGSEAFAAVKRNTVFHWMQMLNLGLRIPGVVNTDAHYSFHGSGGLRNYIRCSTDDPARIDVMEIVRSASAGRVVMTNGPFLEVTLTNADGQSAGPGEDLVSRSHPVQAHIRVQCPNWLDINRVQLFANGRPMADRNFTRRDHPELFADGVVKFDQTIPLEFAADTHLIVVAAGEGLTVGEVMGPQWGAQMPIAVANPVFIDVDGNGFQANGDLLDVPLPLEMTMGLPVR
jgi:hypothetical protein